MKHNIVINKYNRINETDCMSIIFRRNIIIHQLGFSETGNSRPSVIELIYN